MRFTHQNRNYEIDFEYNCHINVEEHYPRRGVFIYTEREVIITIAQIYEKTSPKTRLPILYGQAICQPEDRFVKETGRTLALRDAVKNLQDQSLKVAIFECYFNRPRGISKNGN